MGYVSCFVARRKKEASPFWWLLSSLSNGFVFLELPAICRPVERYAMLKFPP
jgi:hypothetical protein